jgi:hypothetical protein
MNSSDIVNIDQDNVYRQHIIDSLIKPDYEKNIKNVLKERLCWSKISDAVETISNLLLIVSSLFGTLITIYPTIKIFGILAAIIPVMVVALNNFSTAASHKSDKLTNEGNILLENLKIKTIPDITADGVDSTQHNVITTQPQAVSNIDQDINSSKA